MSLLTIIFIEGCEGIGRCFKIDIVVCPPTSTEASDILHYPFMTAEQAYKKAKELYILYSLSGQVVVYLEKKLKKQFDRIQQKAAATTNSNHLNKNTSITRS